MRTWCFGDRLKLVGNWMQPLCIDSVAQIDHGWCQEHALVPAQSEPCFSHPAQHFVQCRQMFLLRPTGHQHVIEVHDYPLHSSEQALHCPLEDARRRGDSKREAVVAEESSMGVYHCILSRLAVQDQLLVSLQHV